MRLLPFHFGPLLISWIVSAVSGDFTLVCNPGYRVSSIRRANSLHQRDRVGSLAIDCQPIIPALTGENKSPAQVKCEPLEQTPQCNGWAEGCAENQWLGGFNAYVVDNSTSALLLDPICCSSPTVQVDQTSCAAERLNEPKRPFEHSVTTNDFVYRGLHCWHQYDATGTVVDLVWKVEICQFHVKQRNNNVHSASSTNPSDNCPPCTCQCGINICGNGNEPVRVTHKTFLGGRRCACNCVCRFECI